MSTNHERKNSGKKDEFVGFFGVGFDHEEGEHRLTRSEHFILVGGSQKTHEHLQDTAIKLAEALKQSEGDNRVEG